MACFSNQCRTHPYQQASTSKVASYFPLLNQAKRNILKDENIFSTVLLITELQHGLKTDLHFATATYKHKTHLGLNYATCNSHIKTSRKPCQFHTFRTHTSAQRKPYRRWGWTCHHWFPEYPTVATWHNLYWQNTRIEIVRHHLLYSVIKHPPPPPQQPKSHDQHPLNTCLPAMMRTCDARRKQRAPFNTLVAPGFVSQQLGAKTEG